MSALTPERFQEFFAALHGDNVSPFPWQRRLAQRVLTATDSTKAWPEAMALPTSSGKTACIDIAIYALAAQAGDEAAPSTIARRIFFVVDRRVIVDEAYERARRIAGQLEGATSGILREVADALRSLSGDREADPLQCFQLRGGVYRDDAWARTPTQATVIASTVDQIGSRMLFRGYGVSPGMRPIHAGLTGNDALVILDEAHCAQPFMQTLLAIREYRRSGEAASPAPFQVVLMSATPPPELKDRLDAEDDDYADPVLGKRLRASKPARLVVAAKATGKKAIEELSAQLALEAASLSAGEVPKAVAVIVNRIAAARRVRELLAKRTDAEVVLLMGRMRPIDRDAVTEKWLKRLSADVSGARKLEGPVFIVATQCLEVGANLDFDALVTECASLDALRQRFGRLNRTGREIPAAGVVVIRADQVSPAEKPEEEDPIYGNSLARTWAWLKARAKNDGIDFGVQAMAAELGSEPDRTALLAPASSAPVLLPAYLDSWVQTAPEPAPSPDVSIFLHGPERGVADVQVCWRADLSSAPTLAAALEILSLAPPSSLELMPVSYSLLARSLAGEPISDNRSSDVEGDVVARTDEPRSGPVPRAIRWRGPRESTFIESPNDLKPGDTIVLSTDAKNWNVFGYVPVNDSAAEAVDIGDQANLRARARPVLRLHPSVVSGWPAGAARSAALDLIDKAQLGTRLEAVEFPEALHELLALMAGASELPSWLRDLAGAFTALKGKLPRAVTPYPCINSPERVDKGLPPPYEGLILHSREPMDKYARSGVSELAEEDDSSGADQPRLLRQHCDDVVREVRKFLAVSKLPEAIAADVTLAASLHDVGKADPRFQALLRGGDRRISGEPLAKSDRLPSGRDAYVAARDRAGYPAGGRHELLSVRLLESNAALLSRANDPELVLHLIASHHGYARPFAPAVEDADPKAVALVWENEELRASTRTELERLDSGVAERFWRLVRRYGWWGLSYLEGVLRLADHRASERPGGNGNNRAHES